MSFSGIYVQVVVCVERCMVDDFIRMASKLRVSRMRKMLE